MSAIDDTSKVIIYQYKNKEWIKLETTFPANMTWENIREYYDCTNILYNGDSPDMFDNTSKIEIYSNSHDMEYFKKHGTYKYIVELDMFIDHGYQILCDTYIDLIQLLNELMSFIQISMPNMVQEIHRKI